MNKIDSFQGEYRFLSNFVGGIFDTNGDFWPSVEHAFQAMKTRDLGQREMIRNATTPGLAKRLGRTVTLRPDWGDVRVSVMEKLVRRKFCQNKELGKKLLATADAELVEGNTWNDKFWGVCKGTGQNHLGKILMKIREELR